MVGPGSTNHLYILRFFHNTYDKVFPGYVIKKVYNLEKELCRLGMRDIMICCDKIEVGFGKKFTIPAHEMGGFGGTHISFQQFTDKKVIITMFVLAIALLQLGYIKDLTIDKSNGADQEYEELWQTAWSILINLEEV